MSDASHPRDRLRERCAFMPGVVRGRFIVYPQIHDDGLRYFVWDPELDGILPRTKGGMVPGTLGTLAQATSHAERLACLHPGDFSS